MIRRQQQSRFQCACRSIHVSLSNSLRSFLRNQELLEADAREALPYVGHQLMLLQPHCPSLTVAEYRKLHEDSWTASTKRLCLPNMQSCHSRPSRMEASRCMLCLLRAMPRRTHASGNLPETKLYMRLRYQKNPGDKSMHTPNERSDQHQRQRSFRRTRRQQ